MVHRQGTPVNPEELTAMSNCLTRHAPDTTGRWLDGSAGFFHALRFTTPESLEECLPYHDHANAVVITADARIDNREELGAELSLATSELAKMSDSELLLKGYLQWGEDLLQRLLGDFTFVIWNTQQRWLFCARDHFGVRPFYHTSIDDEFVFATDLKALLDHPRVPKRLNLERWLGAVSWVDPEQTATFYEGIYRLAPGTWLRVDEHGLVKRRYWTLDPERELAPRTNEQFAKEFRTIFTEAVRCRLRSAYPIGSHLSGGLDSSSVTCVAREVLRDVPSSTQLPLRTFSNIVQTVRDCDESEYIAEVLAGGDLAPLYARPDCAGVFFAYDEFVKDEHDFIFVANLNLLEHLGVSARKAGVRVCLDGFDGDTTIGHGFERFANLVQAKQWSTFSREAQLLASLMPDVQTAAIFSRHALPALDKFVQTRQWRDYFKANFALQRHFNRKEKRSLVRHLLKAILPRPIYAVWRFLRGKHPFQENQNSTQETYPFFESAVAKTLQNYKEAHAEAPDEGLCAARSAQCEKLSSGLFSHALEVTGRLHERHGVDARHPFLDKRLVEFCVALPADQKLRDGYTRHILREGMRGVLPENIRLRTSKTDYTPAHVGGILRFDTPQIQGLISSLPDGSIVKIDALQRYLRDLVEAKRTKEKDFLDFWHTLMSAIWLQGAGFKLESGKSVP